MINQRNKKSIPPLDLKQLNNALARSRRGRKQPPADEAANPDTKESGNDELKTSVALEDNIHKHPAQLQEIESTLPDTVIKAEKAEEAKSADPAANGKAAEERWNPFEGDQTALLYDASSLCIMEEWRNPANNQSRPGVGLFHQTAQLPNVKIIVPAYIAYLEMQGWIPADNEKGRIPIDKLRTTHLFDGASRVIADNAGNIVEAKRGTNPNIIIWEGKKDRELFTKISSYKSARQWDKIMETRVDAGEKCIDAIAETLPTPAIIIADDIKWRKKRDLYTTRHGYPISEENAAAYLVAELKNNESRRDMLLTHLNEPDSNIISILNSINEWRKKHNKKEHHFLVHSKRGKFDAEKFDNSRHPESLKEVIQKGWAMLQKQAAHSEDASAGPPSWVSSILTSDIKPDPDRIPLKAGRAGEPYFDPAAQRLHQRLYHFLRGKVGWFEAEGKNAPGKDAYIEILNEPDEQGTYQLYAVLHCKDKATRNKIAQYLNEPHSPSGDNRSR